MESKKKTNTKKPWMILPAWETYFYISVHISVVAYITYCVYMASNNYGAFFGGIDFQSGWAFIKRGKDNSDFEWHFFYNLFWSIYPSFFAYIALDWVASRHMSFIYRRMVCLSYSVILLIYLLGWKTMLLQVLHCTVMYLVCLLQSKCLVWMMSIALISTLNIPACVTLMNSLTPEDSRRNSYYALMATLSLTHLRYTSFCLERVEYAASIKQYVFCKAPLQQSATTKLSESACPTRKPDEEMKQKEEIHFSLLDAFSYCFYYPLFFTGPIITYDDFSKQMNESEKKTLKASELKSIAFQATRVIFWTFFIEFILHFLYVNAFQNNVSTLENIDQWTLWGIGYCQGHFFMIKYWVLFGLPSVVARICGIVPPEGPNYVGHIYKYSDMWKCFDRGMYNFIKRYIYVPLGGSKGNTLQRLVCSASCFIFVFIWHGTEYYIFIWTLLNFIGISLEVFGSWVDKQTAVFHFKTSMPAAYRRIQCFVSAPIAIMSILSAFCFIGGSSIGNIYYQTIIVKGSMKSWLTNLFVMYCCVHSSIEIDKWLERKPKKD
ncbi:protein-cysteine N-palmitoyltransferase HHAT-like isoform X1 [Mytilus galloprovincialis]|uniref:protein-cysteine N-palmitoyltransferase HHAT-like isoform X1 n=2 Tax=Mytilus galloprovincialis TaxID=29158 RepID=UPI003F7C80B2